MNFIFLLYVSNIFIDFNSKHWLTGNFQGCSNCSKNEECVQISYLNILNNPVSKQMCSKVDLVLASRKLKNSLHCSTVYKLITYLHV